MIMYSIYCLCFIVGNWQWFNFFASFCVAKLLTEVPSFSVSSLNLIVRIIGYLSEFYIPFRCILRMWIPFFLKRSCWNNLQSLPCLNGCFLYFFFSGLSFVCQMSTNEFYFLSLAFHLFVSWVLMSSASLSLSLSFGILFFMPSWEELYAEYAQLLTRKAVSN